MLFLKRLLLRFYYTFPIYFLLFFCLYIPSTILLFLFPGMVTLVAFAGSTLYGLVAIFYYRVTQKKFGTYILCPELFLKNRFHLYQSMDRKRVDGCPQACFLEELSEWVRDLPPGTVYTMTTHRKIIDLVEKTPEYQQGLVHYRMTYTLYLADLKKTEKRLYLPVCDTCTRAKHEEKCSVYCAKKVRKKRKVVCFFGVTITRDGKPCDHPKVEGTKE